MNKRVIGLAKRMAPWRRRGAILGVCIAAACSAAVQPANAQSSRAPIRVGAVSALSGPVAFPEASRAAAAYFDSVNAAGGINGRRIEYLSLDEMPDAAAAARSADRLVSDPSVVALVGGSGVFDCAVNGKRYVDAGVMSLQGASVAPECFFSSPNIVPMNNGPYMGLASAVIFARERLHSQRLCVAVLDLPNMTTGYERALGQLAKKTGRPSPDMHKVPPGGDATEVLRKFKEQHCDTAIYTGHEPAVLQWMASAREQGLTGVNWVFLAPAYTAALADALKSASDPVYAMSEFEPWQSRSMPLNDWRRLMRDAGLPASSLSQGGYVAAQFFVGVLRGMHEPITRESVTRALRNIAAQPHPMLGSPLAIGKRQAHAPNRTALAMKLEDGTWRIASPFWIKVPDLSDEDGS